MLGKLPEGSETVNRLENRGIAGQYNTESRCKCGAGRETVDEARPGEIDAAEVYGCGAAVPDLFITADRCMGTIDERVVPPEEIACPFVEEDPMDNLD